MDFKATLKLYQTRVEQGITKWTPSADTKPPRLHESMRYSLIAGGKRLRPVLVISTAEMFTSTLEEEKTMPAAIAIECIHTYSLIHDDLPGIDNSDLRRGKPTCHKQFDEATALLAGDALLTYAFELLSTAYFDNPTLAVALTRELSIASGSQKLIGGQMEDILGEDSDYTEEQLQYIHLNKTAALITCALKMGALIGGANEQEISLIEEIGKNVGLAFQVTDDILDHTSDDITMGKTTGLDKELEKTTYIKLFGLEGAREKAKALTQSAEAACKQLNKPSDFLLSLIQYLEHRIH